MTKKFVTILICFLCQLFGTLSCLASEQISVKLGSDYLIMSDEVVKNTLVSNPEILSLSPFFTIFNEKNVLLLHPIKQGSSDVTVLFDKTYENFKIKVEPQTSNIADKTIRVDGIEIMLLDNLPLIEEFEIDEPPKVKE